MSKFTNEDYRALATVAAEVAPSAASAGIIVDADSMSGAWFRLSAGGACTIAATAREELTHGFFTDAARSCGVREEDVYNGCGAMRAPFKRYLRRGKTGDEPLPGFSAGCKQLDEIYERDCGEQLRRLVKTLRDQSGEDVPVILVGRVAAFYPAEHTVRQMLSFMPFSPVVEGLVTDPALVVSVDELIERGKAILEEQEKAKKRMAHNIMIQFKHADGDKLTDWLHILANKGTDLVSLEQPVYSDPVLICAQDPITVFADSTPYRLQLPEGVFFQPSFVPGLKQRETLVTARFGLGLAGDTPRLLVQTDVGVTQVELDKKIYSEE